jgi:haloacetate dehalogenase
VPSADLDPWTIATVCADFRAAVGPDLSHDEESIAAGHKIECRSSCYGARKGLVGPGHDPLGIWQQCAPDVRGQGLRTGHFVLEEAPGSVTDALKDFLN